MNPVAFLVVFSYLFIGVVTAVCFIAWDAYCSGKAGNTERDEDAFVPAVVLFFLWPMALLFGIIYVGICIPAVKLWKIANETGQRVGGKVT